MRSVSWGLISRVFHQFKANPLLHILKVECCLMRSVSWGLIISSFETPSVAAAFAVFQNIEDMVRNERDGN